MAQDINDGKVFCFIGYDIREVTDVRAIPREVGYHGTCVLSADLTVCERYSGVTDWDWSACGKTKNARGMFLRLDTAQEVFRTIDEADRSRYRVLGYSVEEDEVLSRYTTEQAAKLGIELQYNAVLAAGFEARGFDVATVRYRWISCLTNCGVDMASVPLDAGEDLGEGYLLKQYRHGAKLRDYANQEIPEHAPFIVWKVFSCSE